MKKSPQKRRFFYLIYLKFKKNLTNMKKYPKYDKEIVNYV